MLPLSEKQISKTFSDMYRRSIETNGLSFGNFALETNLEDTGVYQLFSKLFSWRNGY